MTEAQDLRIVLCTFPTLEEARQIGTALVEMQLAACVNFLPAVESVYRWQGKVETAQEVLAIFKTTADGYPRLESHLIDLHPYETPEIVAIRPSDVCLAYAKWVGQEVTQ
jgi:periplasmic divalent cation tolerance protein